MKTKPTHYLSLAIAASLGFFAIPGTIRAQDFHLRDLNPFGESNPGGLLTAPPISKNMKQCVYTLDTLADQMVFRYGWEVRSNPACEHSDALHKQMKAHAKLTNELVKTSRGKSAEDFKKAAREARESVTLLQSLEKKAKVSNSVSKMIERSDPIATYILANADSFEVKPLLKLGQNGPTPVPFAFFTPFENRRGKYGNETKI